MGRAKLVGGSIRAAECNRDIELAARHHEHVWRVVHDLIESDQRKAEGHEFDNRAQTDHGCADAESGETVFANRSVDNSLGSKSFEQPLAYFISAVIFRDFLAHQKNIRIARQFFGQRFVQCLTVSDLSHDSAFGAGAPSRRFHSGSIGPLK